MLLNQLPAAPEWLSSMKLALSADTLVRLRREAEARGIDIATLADQLIRKALGVSEFALPQPSNGHGLQGIASRLPAPLANPEESVNAARQNPDQLLGVHEVAEVLRVSKRTVYAMVHRKDLPAPLHIGKYACWKWADVQGFLDRSFSRRGLRRRRARRDPAA